MRISRRRRRTACDDCAARFGCGESGDSRRGHGAAAGDYPVDAKLTFSNLGLSAVAAAMMPARIHRQNFDGSAAGEVTLSGPGEDARSASRHRSIFRSSNCIRLSVTRRREEHSQPGAEEHGPIRATLARSVIRVESAHFQAPSTDLDV